MGNLPHHCCGRMCPKVSGLEHDIFDEVSSCDPAGAIFRETLEDLNEVDRLLLLFSSSINLAAVRWLFVLGASRDACDTNGTTCLHAACRSGSVAIVQDLIARGLPLNAADVTGWTALHIAAFMGRRSVAVELMQSGIDLSRHNLKGMAAAELCSDGWLREAIYSCSEHCQRHGKSSGSTWRFGQDHEIDVEDMQASSRLRFEPFFVPRVPILRDAVRAGGLQQLGIEIFNQRPGQGLAFLVATGAVRDFPIELSTFLLENSVSPVKVGEFLGEDFSLSQTLRLEFINSVRLTGTGVVSCLAKVFSRVHIPSDMQKIDRLLEGVAQIWWRQHERLKDVPRQIHGDQEGDGAEVEGLQLLKSLANYGVLHQLMFSSVLLHWNLYADLPPSQRITLSQWLEMNDGFGGPDVSDKDTSVAQRGHVGKKERPLQQLQCLIYNAINKNFLPQLQIWSAQTAELQSSLGKLPPSPATPIRDPGATIKSMWKEQEPAKKGQVLESWACLVGGGFPSTGSTVTYRHVRSIHCETTPTTIMTATPQHSRQYPESGPAPPTRSREMSNAVSFNFLPRIVTPKAPKTTAANLGGSGDRVWLSLRHALLFFATKPQHWAPYAFVPLSHICLRSIDALGCSFTLEGSREATPSEAESAAAKPGEADPARKVLPRTGGMECLDAQVQIIFLLPDGRWQAIEVPQLEVQVMDSAQLEKWCAVLSQYCSATVVRPPVSIDTGQPVGPSKEEHHV